jgi:regulatory protein
LKTSRRILLRNRKSLISKSTELLTVESAYQYALRLLSARDYSVARLRSKLAARGVVDEDQESVLLRLQDGGWLNDRRYAERFAGSALSDGRFFGPRLRQEMRRRGFDAPLVDDVLAALQEGLDETAEIRNVVEKKYPDFVFSSAPDRDKRRITAYLQRRGFGLSAIFRVLKTVDQD